jgi:hypothetical protein
MMPIFRYLSIGVERATVITCLLKEQNLPKPAHGALPGTKKRTLATLPGPYLPFRKLIIRGTPDLFRE